MKLHTALFLALSLAATSPLYAADDTGAPMSSGSSTTESPSGSGAAGSSADGRYGADNTGAPMSPGSTMESPSGTRSGANGGYGAGDAAARDAALQAYEAAKEDCRKLSTGAQADCLEDAAAAYAASQGATPSDTTAQEPTANPGTAMDPVGSTGADPRGYEEAKSQCDTLTEDQRNVCLNDLQTRFPQQ